MVKNGPAAPELCHSADAYGCIMVPGRQVIGPHTRLWRGPRVTAGELASEPIIGLLPEKGAPARQSCHRARDEGMLTNRSNKEMRKCRENALDRNRPIQGVFWCLM